MARSSWLLIALVGLAMVGSGLAMMEACPEGQEYADCGNPCGENPEDNPCAGRDDGNTYCKVKSWCKPIGADPWKCDFTCGPAEPAFMVRTMMMPLSVDTTESDKPVLVDDSLMYQTGMVMGSSGEQPLPEPVEYLEDGEGNMRPVAYNFRGGVVPTDGVEEGPVEKYEGEVDPRIYQNQLVDPPEYLPVPTSVPVYKPTGGDKVYKGEGSTTPYKGDKKSKGGKCPKGVPMVRCIADPCTYTTCAYGTQCVASYCGSCSATCQPIKGGKKPSRGPSECKAGSYLAKMGKSTTCKKCPAGFYTPEEGSYSSCSKCPSGTYAPRSGAYKCLSCPYGTSSKPGARRCRKDTAKRG